MADWSSLPEDLVLRVAGCLLADDDLDYYMNLRAVCSHWRQSTLDPKKNSTDPRFQPKIWAVLKNTGHVRGSCVISMVNLRTCRVLRKKIPMLRNYYFLNATDGGLLVLGEQAAPDSRACVVNPFTGSEFFFTVPICSVAVSAVAVTTSPMRLFVSDIVYFLGWADLNSQRFEEFSCIDMFHHGSQVNMTQIAGDVHVATFDGSIVSTTDGGTRGRSGEMITMSTIIHDGDSRLPGGNFYEYYHNYGVESAGELLFVSKRIDAAAVVVHKVDTRRKVLEPMTSIGRRAIFISQARSFVVDAFPTIEPGCIYFVDPTMHSLRHYRVIATLFRLAEQEQEDIMLERGFGPPTLVEVLADYCRCIPTYDYDFLNGEHDEFWEINGVTDQERCLKNGCYCNAFRNPLLDVIPC